MIAKHSPQFPDFVTLFVSFGALLDMVRSVSVNIENPIVKFPWESWAKHTAWMSWSSSAFHRAGCVFGSRAAYLIGDVDTMGHTLSILDLSLRGTKKADRRSVESLDVETDRFADSVFEGSHQPTVISTFHLKHEVFGRMDDEQLPEAYPVVTMDEDHCKLTPFLVVYIYI